MYTGRKAVKERQVTTQRGQDEHGCCISTTLSLPGFTLTPALVTLLGNRQLDTTSLGDGDPGLRVGGSNGEDVVHPGREVSSQSVTDVANVESTSVLLTSDQSTNTTLVTTTSHHAGDASVEVDVLLQLASLDVEANGVTDTDERVGVSDGTAVVGDNEGD
jgi:hypothetical protein